MATQVLGTLVAVAGLLWFAFSLTLDRAGQQQAVLSLWGVVGFVGGLFLWALGRIECAISPPQGQGKRGGGWPLLPALVVLLAVAVLLALLFLPSSPQQLKPPHRPAGVRRPLPTLRPGVTARNRVRIASNAF
jgi:hypothetical protein